MSMAMPIINGTRRPFRHLDSRGSPLGRYWHVKREYHRVGGPAIERSNGHKEWWSKGDYYFYDMGDTPSRICDGSHDFPGYHMGEWRYSRLTRRTQWP